jgi:hypothetical protein
MLDPIDRTMLSKKLLGTCPICRKRIYGENLDIGMIDISKIKKFPFAYTYIHNHSDGSIPQLKHAVTLYFDANLIVRSVEESEIIKIE